MYMKKNNKIKDIKIAKLDIDRENRTGLSEVIYCSGKTNENLLKILETFSQKKMSVLGTRCLEEQYNFLKKNKKLNLFYDKISKILILNKKNKVKLNGSIAVCCAGTSDIPIAEECCQTAEFFGAKVNKYFDIGVSSIQRILDNIESIKKNSVIVVVAGMEGALASVIAGLVKSPIIAVPTSIGYGANFQGLSALLTMINSCSSGISVVNIDNGFGAGAQACKILNLLGKKND